MKTCGSCGAKNATRALFCSSCGASFRVVDAEPNGDVAAADSGGLNVGVEKSKRERRERNRIEIDRAGSSADGGSAASSGLLDWRACLRAWAALGPSFCSDRPPTPDGLALFGRARSGAFVDVGYSARAEFSLLGDYRLSRLSFALFGRWNNLFGFGERVARGGRIRDGAPTRGGGEGLALS